VTEQKLKALGIELVKDIYEKRIVLYRLFSDKIDYFLKVNLGLGGENRAKKKPRKSVGRQLTFTAVSSEEKLLEYLKFLAQKIEKDLMNLGITKAKTISLITKSNDFIVKNKTITLSYPISKEHEIFTQASNILQTLLPLNLRLIGIRLTNLEKKFDKKKPTQDSVISKYFHKTDEDIESIFFKKEDPSKPPADKPSLPVAGKRRSSLQFQPTPKSKKRKSDPGQTTLDRFFNSPHT